MFWNNLNLFFKLVIIEFSLLVVELFMMMWIYFFSDIFNDEEDEFSYVIGVNEIIFLI